MFCTGAWGLLNGSTTSDWNMNSATFLSDKALGSPAFFTVDISIDDKNSSQYILEVRLTFLEIVYRCCIVNRCLCNYRLLSLASLSHLDNRTAADVSIIESVDSISRDGPDVTYT